MRNLEDSFALDIEYGANGEAIVAIVVEPFGWDDVPTDGADEKGVPERLLDVVVSWDDVREYLDYSYNSGHGGRDCHYIKAWTESKVLYLYEYDGATSITSMPRHPSAD